MRALLATVLVIFTMVTHADVLELRQYKIVAG
jgi:hypothetical protein